MMHVGLGKPSPAAAASTRAPDMAVAAAGTATRDGPSRSRRVGWILVLPVLVHVEPLGRLAQFAANDSRYSHVLLIPLISLYLAWLEREGWRGLRAPRLRPAAIIVAAAAVMLPLFALSRLPAGAWSEDRLAITTLSFVVALVALTGGILGRAVLGRLRFALGFLLFMVPLPHAWMAGIETLSQHGSALVAHALFNVAGSTVHFQDLTFQLPGINLHVAPECSGIRSTFVLLIVSVLTGHLFLRSALGAALLAAAVLPLALLRNGFRIFTIGELCTRIGPDMINSFLHRQGGPIFFALSLVPLLGVLVLVARAERRLTGRGPTPIARA